MINFIKKNAKMYMTLSMLILIGTIGVTYAYYSASVTNDSEVVGTAGGGSLPTLTISRISTEADGNLIPINMDTETLTKAASRNPKCIDNKGYTACQIYSVTVTNNTNISQSYNIELTSLTGATTPNVDAVTMGTSDNTVTSANSIKNNGLICTTNNIGNGDTTTACYFMVIIKNLNEAQTDSGTFNGTVTVTSSTGSKVKARFGTGEKLTTTIENLYNNASKTEVDAEDGVTYNYATGVSLMNDRFGTMTTSINDGNIRYYGGGPDNYIDIGDVYEQDVITNNWEQPFLEVGVPEAMMPTTTKDCLEFLQCSVLVPGGFFETDYDCETQLPYLIQLFGYSSVDEACSTTISIHKGTTILYRIIGLFKDVELADGSKKDLIKVIRDDTIGHYAWDTSDTTVNNGYGINEWNQADLMKLLNPTYEKETVGGSLYWNSDSGNCYTEFNNGNTSCDFTNTGLSTSAKNNIEAVKWNLGGWNNSELFANQMYSYERQGNVYQIGSNIDYNDTVIRKTVWSGRVALAYPSDYGYAVDFNNCDSNLFGYSICKGTNWMYNSLTTVNGTTGSQRSWLLTPYSDDAENAWDVTGSGGVDSNDNVNNDFGVSPVFYLDSELTVESGTGRSDDPYVVW